MGLDSFGVVVYSKTVFVTTSQPSGLVLKLNGVGFRSFASRGWLVCQVGYSHYLGLRLPNHGVARPTKAGIAVVGSGVATRVTALRRPDPYKARGIYSVGCPPRTKEGKRR